MLAKKGLCVDSLLSFRDPGGSPGHPLFSKGFSTIPFSRTGECKILKSKAF